MTKNITSQAFMSAIPLASSVVSNAHLTLTSDLPSGMRIPFVDLQAQYLLIKEEVDSANVEVIAELTSADGRFSVRTDGVGHEQLLRLYRHASYLSKL